MKERQAKHLFGEVHASENVPSGDFLRETANNERNCLFKRRLCTTMLSTILQNGFYLRCSSELLNERKCYV